MSYFTTRTSPNLHPVASALALTLLISLLACPEPYYDDDDDSYGDDDTGPVTFTTTFVNETGYFLNSGSTTVTGALVGGFSFVNLSDGESVTAPSSSTQAVYGATVVLEAEATDSDGCTYAIPATSFSAQSAMDMRVTFTVANWTQYCP